MHVYKTLNLTRFKNGEVVTRQELKGCGALEFPYKFIQTYGIYTIGVNDLPKDLFSKEYCSPAVTESNIWEKIQAVKSMLQDYKIDISINLYVLSENKVHNTMVTSDKIVTATRVTSSITLLCVSKTSRPRHHNTSFNLVLSPRNATLFHCSNCLNVGKFMYHNSERFYYDKGPEELAKILKVSIDSLTSESVGW